MAQVCARLGLLAGLHVVAFLVLRFLLAPLNDLWLVGTLDNLEVLEELLVFVSVEDYVLLVLDVPRVVDQRYLEWLLLPIIWDLAYLLDRWAHECRLWVVEGLVLLLLYVHWLVLELRRLLWTRRQRRLVVVNHCSSIDGLVPRGQHGLILKVKQLPLVVVDERVAAC